LFRLGYSNIYSKKIKNNFADLNLSDFPQKSDSYSSTKNHNKRDTLVIDEISMVRADLFDKINELLKMIIGNTYPFGGMRLILVGDVYQLPPVVKERKKENTVLTKTDKIFSEIYGADENAFFFKSKIFREIISFNKNEAIKGFDIHYIELAKQHRQQEGSEFLKNLNCIRYGDDSNVGCFSKIEDRESSSIIPFITLYKEAAREKNKIELEKKGIKPVAKKAFRTIKNLKGEMEITDRDIVEGEDVLFTDDTRAEKELKLVVGAKVMSIENDPAKRYYNGMLGTVTGIGGDYVEVLFENKERPARIERHTWDQNIDFWKDKKLQKEKVCFKQFPIILAYAMTIHKAQGMTLEKAFIDFYHEEKKEMGKGFSFGQIYVALSRVKNIEDITLGRELTKQDIDPEPELREQVDHFVKELKEISIKK
jgi:ATP-dependent exoDNAse (exonuclease V) alpha subunit